MNKFKAFAASAALAIATVAAPSVASAATSTVVSQAFFYSAADETGTYSASLSGAGDFTIPFTFNVGAMSGSAGVSITNISMKTTTLIQNLVLNLNGTNYAIIDVTPTIQSGKTYFYKTGGISQDVLAGAQSLTISGTVPSSSASFSGTIDFTPSAVPEPASWGLMILGFGVAGASLRRRSAQTAKLKLA